MKRNIGTIVTNLFLSIFLLFVTVSNVSGEGYESLKGVKSIKAVFDVRMGNPKSTALHLKLIHQTYKDEVITAVTKKPSFTVVFIGPAVKLVSKNREGFVPEDLKALDEIANTISEMSKDGIKLELCLVAANLLGVEASSVLPEIKHVKNGWISVIGYQARGYSLVPVY